MDPGKADRRRCGTDIARHVQSDPVHERIYGAERRAKDDRPERSDLLGMLNGNGSSLGGPSGLGSDGASFTVTRGPSTAPVSSVSSTAYTTNPSYTQQSLPPWKR